MPIVANPLPLTSPSDIGRDRNAVGRLWEVVADCAAFIRALVSGRVFEWHEDELIDTNLAPIKHNLRRRPWGAIVVRNNSTRTLVYYYDNWNEIEIVLGSSSGSMTVSFVLF